MDRFNSSPDHIDKAKKYQVCCDKQRNKDQDHPKYRVQLERLSLEHREANQCDANHQFHGTRAKLEAKESYARVPPEEPTNED